MARRARRGAQRSTPPPRRAIWARWWRPSSRSLRHQTPASGAPVPRPCSTARCRRTAPDASRSGRHRDQRPRAGVVAPRTASTAREEPASREPDRAGDPPARRMGGDAAECVRAGVQHQPRDEGGAAGDVGGPHWIRSGKGGSASRQEDADWLAGVLGEIGEEKGRKALQPNIVATNGMSARGRGTRSSPSSSCPARCRSR